MSTRCQLGIYEEPSTPIEQWSALIYRHCDGYPGDSKKHGDSKNGIGIVPDIMDFLLRFNGERGIGDYEVCAALLVHHLVTKMIEGTDRMRARMKSDNSNLDHDFLDRYTLNIGVSQSFHGDIEYFYHISPALLKVYGTGHQWKLMRAYDLKTGKKIKMKEKPIPSQPSAASRADFVLMSKGS